MNKFIAKLE